MGCTGFLIVKKHSLPPVSFQHGQKRDKRSYPLWRIFKDAYLCTGNNATCTWPRQFHSTLLLAGIIAVHDFRWRLLIPSCLFTIPWHPWSILLTSLSCSRGFQNIATALVLIQTLTPLSWQYLLNKASRLWYLEQSQVMTHVQRSDICGEKLPSRESTWHWWRVRLHACVSYLPMDGVAAGSVAAEAVLRTRHRSLTFTACKQACKIHFVP